jgi:HSP20 family protein
MEMIGLLKSTFRVLEKDDINIRIIDRNILSIKATRKPTSERSSHIHLRQRPVRIDKKIVLPIATKEGERITGGAAKYTDGVVTLRIPIPEARTIPIT